MLLYKLGYSGSSHENSIAEQLRKRMAIADAHLSREEFPPARKINRHDFAYSRVSLPAFAAWALERDGWDMPPELVALAERVESKVSQLESPAWEGFDEDDPTYPRELDIALLAWRAVTKTRDENKTPKEQIRGWIKETYPDLSEEAKDRIAVVCNWEKKGGKPRRQQDN